MGGLVGTPYPCIIQGSTVYLLYWTHFMLLEKLWEKKTQLSQYENIHFKILNVETVLKGTELPKHAIGCHSSNVDSEPADGLPFSQLTGWHPSSVSVV